LWKSATICALKAPSICERSFLKRWRTSSFIDAERVEELRWSASYFWRMLLCSSFRPASIKLAWLAGLHLSSLQVDVLTMPDSTGVQPVPLWLWSKFISRSCSRRSSESSAVDTSEAKLVPRTASRVR
jgi:hypothetical protein